MTELNKASSKEAAEWLKDKFQCGEYAVNYANAAIMLSEKEQFIEQLKAVSGWLETIYAQGQKENVFSGWDHTKTDNTHEEHTVLPRIIHAAANAAGWHCRGQLVLVGFTDPNDMKRIIKRKMVWRDVVATGHGEYTHTLQWLCVYTKFPNVASAMYSQSVENSIELKDNGKKPQDRYVWDFICDCLPPSKKVGDAYSWKTHLLSKTARCPQVANQWIIESNTFIGNLIKNRYVNRKWQMPELGKDRNDKSNPKKTILDKHKLVVNKQLDINERKVQNVEKGYRALQTGKTGFILARRDEVLAGNGSLDQIAQSSKPVF